MVVGGWVRGGGGGGKGSRPLGGGGGRTAKDGGRAATGWWCSPQTALPGPPSPCRGLLSGSRIDPEWKVYHIWYGRLQRRLPARRGIWSGKDRERRRRSGGSVERGASNPITLDYKSGISRGHPPRAPPQEGVASCSRRTRNGSTLPTKGGGARRETVRFGRRMRETKRSLTESTGLVRRGSSLKTFPRYHLSLPLSLSTRCRAGPARPARSATRRYTCSA